MITTTIKNEKPVNRKTDDPKIALLRAVKSRFGASATWLENKALSSETRKFGQVGKSYSAGGYNMISDVIYIDIESDQ
ncbi:hypothetical protein [Pseudoalteromonas sp.]|uniref:hypothetical protein n=1 Tax=Pseudoalteromonas sp. TaxID=53249 RepID=UPI00356AC516